MARTVINDDQRWAQAMSFKFSDSRVMEELNRYQLSDIQRRTFTSAFELFDKTKTGVVLISDFPALFRSIGQNPTEADLKRIAVSLTANGSEVRRLSPCILLYRHLT